MTKNADKKTGVAPSLTIRGIELWDRYLSATDQAAMLAEIREVVAAAPMFHPVTPSGRRMSVRMTSAGRYGWISDRSGYRYEEYHPEGMAWPPIPSTVLQVWEALSGTDRAPDCCLINLYRSGARMGMHQDRDEADFGFPVLSISLGDEALFRIGGTTRGARTESVWLKSGDVVRMGGDARLAYHGIDRVRDGSSTLLSGGGRLNLTLRVVT